MKDDNNKIQTFQNDLELTLNELCCKVNPDSEYHRSSFWFTNTFGNKIPNDLQIDTLRRKSLLELLVEKASKGDI